MRSFDDLALKLLHLQNDSPSEMAGGVAPRLAAFFAIHSRATRTLSSVPALSWKTETEKPPLAVRSRETLTKPWTARISFHFRIVSLEDVHEFFCAFACIGSNDCVHDHCSQVSFR